MNPPNPPVGTELRRNVPDDASTAVPRLGDRRRRRPRLTDDRLPMVLWSLAALLLATVVFYSVILPLTPVRLARNSAGLIERSAFWTWVAALPWPVPTGAALATSLLVVGGLAFAAYALALAACWRRPSTQKTLLAVLLPATAFLTVSALALPTQSNDIIDYLLSGRVAAAQGASPYDVPPDAFPDDPLLPYASGIYTDDPEQKPPVWIGAAVGVAAVAGDDPATAVMVFRLFFLVVNLINLWLIAAVLRRWRPDHVLAGLVLYAWNPIVALHGQAKFDTLMATFALTAALLLVTGRRQASAVALYLSVLVKLLTLPLLAAHVLGEIFCRRWRSLWVSTGLLVLVTVAAYAPFDGGASRFVEHLSLTEQGGSSLPDVVSLLVIAVTGVLVLWVGFTGRGDTERLLQGWALVALGVVLLSPIGSAWYLIMPIAMVSLCGERWKSLAVVLLSSLAFLFDNWMRSNSSAHPLPDPAFLSSSVIYSFVVSVSAVVLLVAVAVGRSRRPETLGAATRRRSRT